MPVVPGPPLPHRHRSARPSGYPAPARRPPGRLGEVGYQVSTAVFEGPFDLLLHLVTRDQVDIWELSLSSIVDEYLATIEGMQALDLSVATEFLLTAAVLLELKARRLLPDAAGDGEEELALWEERDLLLARLLECKTFKDASLALCPAHGRRRPVGAPARGPGRALPGPGAGPAGRRDRRPAAATPWPGCWSPSPFPGSTPTT